MIMAGDVTTQYGKWAATYDEDKRKLFVKLGMDYDGFTNKLIEECRLFPGINILDVGAGTGLTSIPVAQAIQGECTITAVDPVAEMLDRAKENFANASLSDRVTILQGKGEEIPVPDRAFDLIITTFAMRHMDCEKALSEFARVLKPGGRVVIAESCAPPAWKTKTGKVVTSISKMILSLRKKYRGEHLSTVLSREEWEAALAKAGFAEIKLTEIEGKKKNEWDLFRLLMSARLG
jgi:ubiquinone/menaquinone biosynthesis C-methylase UbiE